MAEAVLSIRDCVYAQLCLHRPCGFKVYCKKRALQIADKTEKEVKEELHLFLLPPVTMYTWSVHILLLTYSYLVVSDQPH